jgi:hypothetical protein
MRVRSLWCAGWLLLASPTAKAQQAPSFELAWVRGGGAELCPAESKIAERVVARLGRDPFAERASHAIEAVVERKNQRFYVSIRVRDTGGSAVGERELALDASDCEPIADAVALAIALVIDPNASLAPPIATPNTDANDLPPATTDLAPAPSTPLPTAPASPAPLSPCAPARACPTSANCAKLDAPPSSLSLSVLARGAVAFGALPGAAPGAGLRGALGSDSVRGVLSLWTFPEQRAADPRFAFGLSLGELGASATILRADSLELSASAVLQAGAIHAVVREMPAPGAGERLFLGAAAGPELMFRASRELRIAVGAELQVPLNAPQFYGADPDAAVFQSSVGARAWLGLGFEVPAGRP